MDKSQLTEMDLHCISRMIQSSFQAPKQEDISTMRPLYGCMYCKYATECVKAVECAGGKFHYRKVFEKLEELTGVRQSCYQCHPLPEEIGHHFFPASYYMEHPEFLDELGKVHPENMILGFKLVFDNLIDCSPKKSGQK